MQQSQIVTGKRRTHVAVVFPDEDAGYIREQITNCLDEIEKQTGVLAKEFHFVDIYNRNNPWNKLPEQMNLMLFELYADIYTRYRWPVYTLPTTTLVCFHRILNSSIFRNVKICQYYYCCLKLPDYQEASANFSSRPGMGGV